MKCENCGKEFEGYGKNCGACRVRLSRKKPIKFSTTTSIVTDVTETPVTEPVTTSVTTSVTETKPTKVKEGFCHGCGEAQPSKNVCICYKCIEGRITHKSLGLDIAFCVPKP